MCLEGPRDRESPKPVCSKSEKELTKISSHSSKILIQWVVAAAAKSLQSRPTLCDPIRRQPTRLPRPWDAPGKNTAVGCHFLLQCMKVKRESEVTQSFLTPSNPMDCSPPGSSVHGIFQARVLEWVAIAFSNTMRHLLKMCVSDQERWNVFLLQRNCCLARASL